jgi:hypothetical protein
VPRLRSGLVEGCALLRGITLRYPVLIWIGLGGSTKTTRGPQIQGCRVPFKMQETRPTRVGKPGQGRVMSAAAAEQATVLSVGTWFAPSFLCDDDCNAMLFLTSSSCLEVVRSNGLCILM